MAREAAARTSLTLRSHSSKTRISTLRTTVRLGVRLIGTGLSASAVILRAFAGVAGKLNPDTPADVNLESLEFIIEPGGPPPIANVTAPGQLTWGRGQGCAFVKQPAQQWPASYTCSSKTAFGCTPDHYMSARCIVLVRRQCGGLGLLTLGAMCRVRCSSPVIASSPGHLQE